MITHFRLTGNWSTQQLSLLKVASVELRGADTIFLTDLEDHAHLWKAVQSSIKTKEATYTTFSGEEVENSSSWSLKFFYPNIAQGYWGGDGRIEYLNNAFEGGYCDTCRMPYGEQTDSLVVDREPRKLRRKSLFGTGNWVGRCLITDLERFKIIKKEFGIKSIPLLIGKKRTKSKNFVQLDVPISSSKLSFGTSKFGMEHPDYHNCCDRKMYHTYQRDFFPEFEIPQESEFTFSQEWFGLARALVIRKKAFNFLIKNWELELDANMVIPVRPFS